MSLIELMELEWMLMRGAIRLLILALLQKSMMTCYQIIKEIQQITERRPSLSTIHDILTDLEERKLIESFTTQQLEKYYKITELGRRILNEARGRSLKKMINIINIILE